MCNSSAHQTLLINLYWFFCREKKCHHISHFNDLLGSNRRTFASSGDWKVSWHFFSNVVKWINYQTTKGIRFPFDDAFICDSTEKRTFYCIWLLKSSLCTLPSGTNQPFFIQQNKFKSASEKIVLLVFSRIHVSLVKARLLV